MCPSVLLKYTLPPFFSGGIYQLPHLSLATRGKLYVSAADITNAESDVMDARRFVIDRAERLRDCRVAEKLRDCVGKMRSA
jgi:hypothetical protein